MGALGGPVNSLLKFEEISYVIANSEARALLVNSEFLPRVEKLAALVAHPAVAVGGITADRALQITVHGAVGVAVINAIFKADDPETATRAIASAIGK